MAFAAIGGAAIGAVGDFAGAYYAAGKSRKAASKQRKFIRWQMRNKYQLQMADMRDAGLNPILAYKQTAPSGGTPGQAQVPSFGGIGSRAVETAKGVSLAQAQKEALRGQASNSREQAKANRMLVAKHNWDAEASRQRALITESERNITNARAEVYRRHPDLMYWKEFGGMGAVGSAKRLLKRTPMGRFGSFPGGGPLKMR